MSKLGLSHEKIVCLWASRDSDNCRKIKSRFYIAFDTHFGCVFLASHLNTTTETKSKQQKQPFSRNTDTTTQKKARFGCNLRPLACKWKNHFLI